METKKSKANGGPPQRKTHRSGAPELNKAGRRAEEPIIWEPSTKNPEKALEEAFGLWEDDQPGETPSDAKEYRAKLWRTKRS